MNYSIIGGLTADPTEKLSSSEDRKVFKILVALDPAFFAPSLFNFWFSCSSITLKEKEKKKKLL